MVSGPMFLAPHRASWDPAHQQRWQPLLLHASRAWEETELMHQQGEEEAEEPAAAPRSSSLCQNQQVSAVPFSSLLWLLFSLVSPWQLSPSLHYQTTCLNFKEVMHIFNRNINSQELLGGLEIRAAKPGISAHTARAGTCLGWDVCWGGALGLSPIPAASHWWDQPGRNQPE